MHLSSFSTIKDQVLQAHVVIGCGPVESLQICANLADDNDRISLTASSTARDQPAAARVDHGTAARIGVRFAPVFSAAVAQPLNNVMGGQT